MTGSAPRWAVKVTRIRVGHRVRLHSVDGRFVYPRSWWRLTRRAALRKGFLESLALNQHADRRIDH